MLRLVSNSYCDPISTSMGHYPCDLYCSILLTCFQQFDLSPQLHCSYFTLYCVWNGDYQSIIDVPNHYQLFILFHLQNEKTIFIIVESFVLNLKISFIARYIEVTWGLLCFQISNPNYNETLSNCVQDCIHTTVLHVGLHTTQNFSHVDTMLDIRPHFKSEVQHQTKLNHVYLLWFKDKEEKLKLNPSLVSVQVVWVKMLDL